MRNENLRRRTDEKDIGFAHVASDEFPYMRFKEPVRIVAFVVMGAFAVTVIYRESQRTLHWYGFFGGQWYTDFVALDTTPEKLEQDLQEGADILLDQAADVYENDLKEPESATVETDTKEPSQEG